MRHLKLSQSHLFSVGTLVNKVCFLNRSFCFALIIHTLIKQDISVMDIRSLTRTQTHKMFFSECIYASNPKNMLHSHKIAQAVY